MENSKYLSNVTFPVVEVTYKGNVAKDQMGCIDIGSIYLAKEGREYNQDVSNSYWKYDEETDTTLIEMALDTDEEGLKADFTSNFELREEDLLSLDKAEIFIGGEYEVEPVSMTLFVNIGEEQSSIELSLEK